MVLHRTHLKMVANVKLQLKVTTLFSHLVDNLVLVLIQFDVGYCGKALKSHIRKIFPVIKNPDGCSG